MNPSSADLRQWTAFLNLLSHYQDADASIYDALAKGYDRFVNHWDGSFALPALKALFAEMLARLPLRPQILDAGCGTGRQIPDIIKYFDPEFTVGIDQSPKMLEVAGRKFGGGRIRFVQGDLKELPFRDESFDAVIAVWVLETMSSPRRAVQEFLRVLRPGGVIGFTFIHFPQPPDNTELRLQVAAGAVEETPSNHPFVSGPSIPHHNCDRSILRRFRNDLISVVTLGKCCPVESLLLPTPVEICNADEPVQSNCKITRTQTLNSHS